MENIIPVLIVVGGLIYKIYQNYQKEMEEARKRQQNMKRVPTPIVDAEPKPAPVAPPTHNQRLGRPKPQKIVISKKEESTREPLKKIPLDIPQRDWPEEVGRIREPRKEREDNIKRLDIEETEELVSIASNKVDFDLRQAVIQSAILERPYKE